MAVLLKKESSYGIITEIGYKQHYSEEGIYEIICNKTWTDTV